jgi:hypothetical protein
MADITYRANLSSASFPLVSEYHGRTIIIPGPDNTYNRLVGSQDVSDRDVGIPQLYYAHNVLPVTGGFHTVTYKTDLPRDSLGTRVTQVFPWYNLGKDGLLGFRGTQVVACTDGFPWTAVGITLDGSSTYRHTKGTVNGQSYLFSYGVSGPAAGSATCHTINLSTFIATPVVLSGLSGVITGIAAVSGYLLAFSDTAIAWSSLTDPTDFVPSLITGAGGANVQEVKGRIVAAKASGFGAVIYTETNAVALTYTGNSRYPFTFEEIKAAGGCLDYTQPDRFITEDASASAQIAITTNGLQSLGPKSATSILPELNDFLQCAYYEDFNEATRTFSRTQYGPTGLLGFSLELNLIAGRYITLSYGPPGTVDSPYTYVIIYDLNLKRYGKLKYTHVSCFENNHQALPTEPAYYANIGLAGMAGQIEHPYISNAPGAGSGVILLGKYQYVRARMLALNYVSVENIRPEDTIQCYDLCSLDGKTTTEYAGYPYEITGTQRFFSFSCVGTNHSILFIGPINLTSLCLEFFNHGKA